MSSWQTFRNVCDAKKCAPFCGILLFAGVVLMAVAGVVMDSTNVGDWSYNGFETCNDGDYGNWELRLDDQTLSDWEVDLDRPEMNEDGDYNADELKAFKDQVGTKMDAQINIEVDTNPDLDTANETLEEQLQAAEDLDGTETEKLKAEKEAYENYHEAVKSAETEPVDEKLVTKSNDATEARDAAKHSIQVSRIGGGIGIGLTALGGVGFVGSCIKGLFDSKKDKDTNYPEDKIEKIDHATYYGGIMLAAGACLGMVVMGLTTCGAGLAIVGAGSMGLLMLTVTAKSLGVCPKLGFKHDRRRLIPYDIMGKSSGVPKYAEQEIMPAESILKASNGSHHRRLAPLEALLKQIAEQTPPHKEISQVTGVSY